MYSFRTFENGPRFLLSQCSKFPDLPIPVFLTAFMRYYLAFPLTTEGPGIDIPGKRSELKICVVFYDAASSVVAYNDGIVD